MDTLTLIKDLERVVAEIEEKTKKWNSFDITAQARTFRALKEEYPDTIFEGPETPVLPEFPNGNETEQIVFVVAKNKEEFDKHELER